MVNVEMTSNPTQIHPIHLQLERFAAHLFGVGPRFGVWSVFDLAEHAAIALAAAVSFSSSVLAFRSVTFGTFDHASIIAQFLATPVLCSSVDKQEHLR